MTLSDGIGGAPPRARRDYAATRQRGELVFAGVHLHGLADLAEALLIVAVLVVGLTLLVLFDGDAERRACSSL